MNTVHLKDTPIHHLLDRDINGKQRKQDLAIRTEVASSWPDHLPTLSAARSSEHSLLVKSPFLRRSSQCRQCCSDIQLQCAGDIEADLYAVGRPVQKRNITQQKRTAKSAPITPCPSREGPYSTVFFGKPAHGPPHVAGGASGPIGGCRDESWTDNPDLDLRHVFDRNNQKTDLI